MKHDMNFMDKINRDLEVRKVACRILDVPENADAEQLKRAYRRAAIRVHPDHNDSSSEAARKFTLVKCAYELLAFNKPCDEILKEISAWPGIPNNNHYDLENSWGRFLWWRDRFFGSPEQDSKLKKNKKPQDGHDSCI